MLEFLRSYLNTVIQDNTSHTFTRNIQKIKLRLSQTARLMSPPPLSSPLWTERNERNESSTSADRDLTRTRSTSSAGAAD